MGAIYGLVGDGDPSNLSVMGSRLRHRGKYSRERQPASRVLFGEITFNKVSECDFEKLSVVADASLYNELELADRLYSDKRQPFDNSPSALIASLFLNYGPDCFALLNGDFVVALWDHVSSRLVLARDPLGARTIYYYADDKRIAFASEYKALLALDAVSRDPDRKALQQLQNSKYLTAEGTLLQSVHQVPAGHWLVFQNGNLSVNRYWDICIEPRPITLVQAEQELRNQFFDAVRCRISGEETLGFSLSGGIDSAAIVAAARNLRPNAPLLTFTIGSGEEDPEIQVARVVSQSFNTRHHELFVEPSQLLEALPLLIWHLEDPIARTETYLYFELAKYASQHVNVLLGGYAGDGLFAGMPKHKLVKIAQVVPFLRSTLEQFYQYTQTSKAPASAAAKLATRLYFGANELPAPTVTGASPTNGDSPFPPSRRGMLDCVLRSGLLHGVPIWMPKVEKPHAAHGLEFRSPFTDTQLIRHSFTLPERFKMRYLQDKYIFRRAMSAVLPSEVAKRPKYPQQMDYDRQLSDVLDTLVERYLNERAVRQRNFFRVSDINELRRRSAGRPYPKNRAMRLWTAIATEVWARIYLDGAGAMPDF